MLVLGISFLYPWDSNVVAKVTISKVQTGFYVVMRGHVVGRRPRPARSGRFGSRTTLNGGPGRIVTSASEAAAGRDDPQGASDFTDRGESMGSKQLEGHWVKLHSKLSSCVFFFKTYFEHEGKVGSSLCSAHISDVCLPPGRWRPQKLIRSALRVSHSSFWGRRITCKSDSPLVSQSLTDGYYNMPVIVLRGTSPWK